MTLSNKQQRFARMVGQLLAYAWGQGYEVTLGDAYRDPRVFGKPGKSMGYGAPFSCHKLRLAIDLNLFFNGVYLDESTAHLPLGEYWESIGGTWGGRFKTPDGNHYSLSHEGHS